MAETRTVPEVLGRDDAFLRDGVRVCPLADNTTGSACWWVAAGRPAAGVRCVCLPPRELWGMGA